MDKLCDLALKTQTVWGAINFLSSVIAWPIIIDLLKDFLLQDRHHFNCDPKPSDAVRQGCYGDYTSAVSPLMVPLVFAIVTFSIVGLSWLVFILYGVRALWRIRKEQDSRRKESLVKRFRRLYLVQVCIRLAFLIVMLVLFCSCQTLSFPEVYSCSWRNSTKIPTNQIKKLTCNDMHHRQKSNLNIGIIAVMAASIILCVVAITRLFCTRKHFMEQLLEDPEGDSTEDTPANNKGSTSDSAREDTRLLLAEDTPENNQGSFVASPGEDFEMLPAEDITAGEESRKSDDPSENKHRRLADTSENNEASIVVPPGEDTKMLPAEGSVELIAQLQQMQLDASKVSDKTDLKFELKKIASDKGFRIVDNEGSGNCMFHALSDQLEIAMGIKIKHDELRQILVQYLRKNSKLPNGTNLFHFVHGHQSWDDYLTYMEQDGTWGDHVILQTAANCYKTYIRVVSSLSTAPEVIVPPPCPVDKSRTLVLGHIHEVHYVSLHSIQADISAPGESCISDDPLDNKRRRLADTSENNQESIVVPPGENIAMLPAEESSIVKKCQEQLKSYYDTFSKVKTVPWDDSNSVDIDEIYTPLYWVRDERTPSAVRQEKLGDYINMFKGNKRHRKPTRMLVYGRPGIGKSTFCKKAAYDWSKAFKKILTNFHILLLIKLRDVCDKKDIRDVLRASKLLAKDCPISLDSLYDYISKNQDKVLLILEGYDEYSCAKEHSPILEIWKGELLRDCQVIVTTRQIKCDELRGPSHVQFEIHGFKSSKQIITFARKFLKDEKDLKDFMSNLREKDLRDMAEIPLLLQMLCLVWNEKGHEGLPTSRADIYNSFIQTMLNHRTAERSAKTEPVAETSLNDLKKDLSSIGKFAFESLLEEVLFIRCSKLPTEISSSLQNLLEVGLFQVVNVASLDPEKGIFFIHKSVQEFLAAWHMKEEVLSMEDESSKSLSKVDSFKKCLTMLEVLRFACELSVEAACAVFHHLVFVGRKESLSEFEFSEPPQSIEDLSKDQQQYLELISHSYFCCSAEKRRDLYSMLLSLTGGILLLDSNQLNIVVNEQLLKCAEIPKVIFFSRQNRSSEKSHRNLITVAEHTDAVAVSCSGKKKAAANFLKKCPRRPLNEFFLKKEEKIILYVCEIRKEDGGTFPTEMLRELISSTAECTQEKRLGDPLNERDNETASRSTENTDSITGGTPHSLSCVTSIDIFNIERQELETLADLLPNCTSLQDFSIFNVSFRTHDAPLTETLVSRIIFTDRLGGLFLQNIKLTGKPAAAIARSLHQAPNLHILELSNNPLGEGVSVLTQLLSCVPHLETLRLVIVKMTKEQVNALSAAVRQSNIELATEYHDEKGNVKPEKDWPTDEYWKEESSDDEQEVESVSDSDDERESGSVSDSDDKWESGSVSDSDDEKESGSVSDLNHE